MKAMTEEKNDQFFILLYYLKMDLLAINNMTDSEREYFTEFVKKELLN